MRLSFFEKSLYNSNNFRYTEDMNTKQPSQRELLDTLIKAGESILAKSTGSGSRAMIARTVNYYKDALASLARGDHDAVQQKINAANDCITQAILLQGSGQ